jgi:hypothetical protein
MPLTSIRSTHISCASPRGARQRSRCLRYLAALHESAERRDAGARADHDDVPIGRRKGEMLVRPQFHPQPATFLEPLGDVGRGDALSRASMSLVAHRGNQQMRLLAYFAARGRDRNRGWSKRTGECAELLGRERDREMFHQVDELSSGDPGLCRARLDQQFDMLMDRAGAILVIPP